MIGGDIVEHPKLNPEKLADIRSFYEKDVKPLDKAELQVMDALMGGFLAHKRLTDGKDGPKDQEAG